MVGTVVGCLCGLIFFGGLWMTVQRLPKLKKPQRFFYGSLLVRMSLVLFMCKAALDVSPLALAVSILVLVVVRNMLTMSVSAPGASAGPPIGQA